MEPGSQSPTGSGAQPVLSDVQAFLTQVRDVTIAAAALQNFLAAQAARPDVGLQGQER